MMRKLLILLSIIILISYTRTGLQAGMTNRNNGQEQASEPAPKPLDADDLEAFVDGIMEAHMRENHIAGATFSAVKDGQVFMLKGYGFADIEKRIPVVADRTLFRPGSVSKLFTWTAVMQLVEQGKIGLVEDVNSYLKDFKIPATFPEPITMIHLLTHTPGFEDKGTGMAAPTPEKLKPLGEFLAQNMPARVRPPGIIIAYSNYGTALAGHIVEVVSGMPFEDYIEENIFKPLDMNHSTFRQPLPPDLAGDMSRGYRHKNGVYESGVLGAEFELINGMAPAGSLSTTAADMARFMIAHLQNGRYGESRFLEEETARRMHSQLFTHDPNLDGNAYGFWESSYNSLYALEHGGDTILFHSMLVLIPEMDFGFFVSYNSMGGQGSPRSHLVQAILDRYAPSAWRADVMPPDDFNERAKKYTGVYEMTRVNSSTYEKLARLVMTIRVKATDKNTLLVSGFGIKSQWAEVSPLMFQEVGGKNTLLFHEDGEGRITHMFLGQSPMTALVKLPWYRTPLFHVLVLALIAIFFLSTLFWPVRALSRKICRRTVDETPAPSVARWLAGLMSLLCLMFLVGAAAVLSNYVRLMFGMPEALKILLVLPIIAAVLAVGVLFFAIAAWVKGYWDGCARLHYTLVFVAFLAFLGFLSYWNLLGFRF